MKTKTVFAFIPKSDNIGQHRLIDFELPKNITNEKIIEKILFGIELDDSKVVQLPLELLNGDIDPMNWILLYSTNYESSGFSKLKKMIINKEWFEVIVFVRDRKYSQRAYDRSWITSDTVYDWTYKQYTFSTKLLRIVSHKQKYFSAIL